MNRRWWWIMPILIFVVLVVWALWRRGWDRTIFTVVQLAVTVYALYHFNMYRNARCRDENGNSRTLEQIRTSGNPQLILGYFARLVLALILAALFVINVGVLVAASIRLVITSVSGYQFSTHIFTAPDPSVVGWLDFLVWLIIRAILALALMSLVMIGYNLLVDYREKRKQQAQSSPAQSKKPGQWLYNGGIHEFREQLWFKLPEFYCAVVYRLGKFTRVVKPGMVAQINWEQDQDNGDRTGTIVQWSERTVSWLGGLFFKIPFLETVDIVYIGERRASFHTIPVNCAGFKTPETKPIERTKKGADRDDDKEADYDLNTASPLSDDKRVNSGDGPQVQLFVTILYRITQPLRYLRLGLEDRLGSLIREPDREYYDLEDTIIRPAVNAVCQDTFPNMLLRDIQNVPPEILLVGTRSMIMAEVTQNKFGAQATDRTPANTHDTDHNLRQDDATTYWKKLLRNESTPFYQIDVDDLTSRDSFKVINTLTNPKVEAPYENREYKNSLLVGLLLGGTVGITGFKKKDVEPEAAIRAKLTQLGEAQAEMHIQAIRDNTRWRTEQNEQRIRRASAWMDSEKVSLICEKLNLDMAVWAGPLVIFFQDRRTREVMAQKGTSNVTMLLADDLLMGMLREFIQKMTPPVTPLIK